MADANVTRLDLIDSINENLEQLGAMLAMPLADDDPEEPAFHLMTAQVQRNYLWACQEKAHAVLDAWRNLDHFHLSAARGPRYEPS